VKELVDEAVVLRTYRSGEADRVAVLWTRHHGKLRILAKGVRKTTSRMGGSLEPMAHVTVDLVKSRGDLYVTRNVTHRTRFSTLRDSYDRIAAGLAVVEVIDAIPSEEVVDEAIFDLLLRVLTTLDNTEYEPSLVPASFFFKLLALDGSAPVLDECVSCASPGPLVSFNAEVGGMLCANCRSGTPVSVPAQQLLQRIMGGQLAPVLRESDLEGASDVAALALHAIEVHFGRRLKVSRSTAPLTAKSSA
jgi:DNA repair protein RecO (recombination protein O)